MTSRRPVSAVYASSQDFWLEELQLPNCELELSPLNLVQWIALSSVLTRELIVPFSGHSLLLLCTDSPSEASSTAVVLGSLVSELRVQEPW